MKFDYAGLICEPLPSGQKRYRVRPEGDKAKRIRIFCGPGEEDFLRQYQIARAGEQPKPMMKASEVSKPKSIGWLVNIYFEYLAKRVEAGTTSAKTLKKKKNLLARLLRNPDRVMLIPQEKLIEMQDEMSATPAQADAFIEAVAVMYDWAKKRRHIASNPARGIDKIYEKGEGSTPWKAADVKAFLAVHKLGSKAHVAISIILWTGARIEDLTVLGRRHECVIEGVEALRWQPSKKGSSEVIVPLLPLLKEATRAPKIQGNTYVLGRGGKPYASGDSMSAMFKRWCVDAGLPHLSAHGVRKGLAELLAELGCSQYDIMAILGHSEAKTSEVYTRRVERWKLALSAMGRVNAEQIWN
jgi:integrase